MSRILWPSLTRPLSPVEVMQEQADSFALAYPDSVWQAYVAPLDVGHVFGLASGKRDDFGFNEKLFSVVGEDYPCKFYWGMIYHRPRLECELVSEIARVLSHITTIELLGMEIVASNEGAAWVIARHVVNFEQAAMLIKATAEILWAGWRHSLRWPRIWVSR